MSLASHRALLRSTTLADLINDAAGPENARLLVSVAATDSVQAVLDVLLAENILAVPVTHNEDGTEFLGFVSVYDLLVAIDDDGESGLDRAVGEFISAGPCV